MACAAFLRPKAMKKNSHRPKGGIAVLRNVRFGDGDLVIGLNQVNFRKNGATRHAVIEGLHVGNEVPVGYCDGVQEAVVTAGAPRPILLGHQMQWGCPWRI